MSDFRRFVHGPGVMLPSRVADWIVRNTNLQQVRNATRGQLDDELAAALAALHVTAQAWSASRAYQAGAATRSSASGTQTVPAPELAASSRYIDVNTIAGQLGMTPEGVRKALRDRRLPGVKPDGKWLASTEDVARFRSTRT